MDKQKKPIFKRVWFWIIIVVLVLIIGGVACSGGGESSSTSSDASNDSASQGQQIEYEAVEVQTLIDDLAANAARAGSSWTDKYVAVTGYISNFDSDGAYIDIDAGEDDYSFTNIQIYLNSDDLKSQVLDYNTGDRITVKGQITDVGELLGYSIDADSIELAQ